MKLPVLVCLAAMIVMALAKPAADEGMTDYEEGSSGDDPYGYYYNGYYYYYPEDYYPG